MENIQRDLAKEITALELLKPTRKKGRWTFLLVGEHGKVVTFRWFSWMIALWGFLLVLAAIVSGLLYYVYLDTRNVNVRLQRSLDNVYGQVAGLHSDKEALMARLVMAETDLENLLARLDPKDVENAPGEPQEDRAAQVSGSNNPGVRKNQTAVSGSNAELTAGIPPDDPAAAEEDRKVSVEDFTVSHESASNTFRVQFIIRNTGPDSEPVSGYSAVILKKPNTQPGEWLTLPTLKLAAGVPTGRKRGQYFSIFRFKTVRFMLKSNADPQQFDTATVYVFDADKNLLLEKDFPINIQETVFPSNQ